MAGSLELGLEIKALREKRSLAAKDLAAQVHLSPSQLSRIETGQRRVDAPTLAKIAQALQVPPSHFFPEQPTEPQGIHLPRRYDSIAKFIRTERRNKHITAQDLGAKIGKGKFFILDLEEGRCNQLKPEHLQKIAKALKIDPWRLFELQQIDYEQAYWAALRAQRPGGDEGDGATPPLPEFSPGEIPVAGLGDAYPTTFDEEGWPLAVSEQSLRLPVRDAAFAVVATDNSMERPAEPSFRRGDCLVFGVDGKVENKGFALARLSGRPSVFRQVYFDGEKQWRLQPLNSEYGPLLCAPDEVLRLYPLLACIKFWEAAS